MRFLVPTGIGDSTWALTKAQAIARRLGDGVVDIGIACSSVDVVQTRSLEYVQRFPFVRSADMVVSGAVLKSGPLTDPLGRYRYLDDGPCQYGYALMPNAPLERGYRLEAWHPEDAIDWTITRGWANTKKESDFADQVRESLGPFAIVYPGPKSGNTDEGHNRGSLWTPAQWIEVVVALKDMGLTAVAIGASYDVTYWKDAILPAMKAVDPSATLIYNLIGQLAIGQTLALIRRAKLGVYYQSGLGVWSAFEGVPAAMFWRPDGNSAHAHHRLCFDERMASAWVPLSELESGRYLPCVYTKTSVPDLISWAGKQ